MRYLGNVVLPDPHIAKGFEYKKIYENQKTLIRIRVILECVYPDSSRFISVLAPPNMRLVDLNRFKNYCLDKAKISKRKATHVQLIPFIAFKRKSHFIWNLIDRLPKGDFTIV